MKARLLLAVLGIAFGLSKNAICDSSSSTSFLLERSLEPDGIHRVEVACPMKHLCRVTMDAATVGEPALVVPLPDGEKQIALLVARLRRKTSPYRDISSENPATLHWRIEMNGERVEGRIGSEEGRLLASQKAQLEAILGFERVLWRTVNAW